MFVCFVLSLSSCHEKAMVVLYIGQNIRTRLGVVHFRVFQLFLDNFLPHNLLFVTFHTLKLIL